MSEIAYWVDGDFAFSIHQADEMGHLCGYLGLPPCHPWSGLDYDDIDASVHGGLTWAGYETIFRRTNPARLKHLMERFKGDHSHDTEYESLPRFIEEPTGPYPHDTGLNLFWIGFDCAHLGDAVPGLGHLSSGDVYRDEGFVRDELRHLATQAAAAAQMVPA